MKQLKRQKGITLIALIITVVVLLILAGVAIGTLEKTNIIGHAQNAAERYEIEKVKENEEISEAEAILDTYSEKETKVGIRAYRKEDTGEVIVLSLEDNKFAIFESDQSIYPAGVDQLTNINVSSLEIDFEGFLAEEEKELEIFSGNIFPGIVAINKNGNKVYYAEADENGIITISASVYMENVPDLVEKFYNDDQNLVSVVESYNGADYITIIDCNNAKGELYIFSNGEERKVEFLIYEIVENTKEFEAESESGDKSVTIRKGVKKVKYRPPFYSIPNSETLIAYIQDDMIYTTILDSDGEEYTLESGKVGLYSAAEKSKFINITEIMK